MQNKMIPSPQPIPVPPELAGVQAALERAALRAREIARQTGTPCVVVRNGQLVDALTGRPLAP
jgi:hypothetical protein